MSTQMNEYLVGVCITYKVTFCSLFI